MADSAVCSAGSRRHNRRHQSGRHRRH